MPARDMPTKEPLIKELPASNPQVAGSTTTATGTPTSTPKPVARPVTPAETTAPVQIKPKLPEPPREMAAAEPVTSSGNTGTGSIGTGTITPRIINRPAEQTRRQVRA